MSELLLQYTDLLHKYRNPDAREVRDFLNQHVDDVVLQQRARKLNALLVLKSALLSASSSARVVKFKAAQPLGYAGDDVVAAPTRLVNAEEGYEVRIYPAAKEGFSTVQLEGELPLSSVRLYAGETPIPFVKWPDQFGYAVVRNEDVLPVKEGTAELRVEIE